MSFLVNFQRNQSRDGLCTACTNVQGSTKANLKGMTRGPVILGNVAKAGHTPMKQSKNFVWTCESMYAILKSFQCSRAFLGELLLASANMHTTQTVLAAGQQRVAN
jgi:hypothetical protein